jgi:hypothetical protein
MNVSVYNFIVIHTCKISDYNSNANDDGGFLGCDTVLFGEWFLTFIQNVRKRSPNDTPLFYKATSLLKGSSFCPLTKVGSLLYEITG